MAAALKPAALPAELVAALKRLLKLAQDREANLYAVGGFARDVLRGSLTTDIDLTIAGFASEVGRQLADEFNATCFDLHDDPTITRIIFTKGEAAGFHIDLSDLRADTIQDDLQLRDFTVNAVAFRLGGWLETDQIELVDPTNGCSDFQAGRLHLGYPAALEDDPVRAIRGIRLVAELGLVPTPVTRSALSRAARHIDQSPGERVGDALTSTLRATRDATPLMLMQRTGILEGVFPESEAMDGCAQPAQHYWDVLRHSFETVLAIPRVVDDLLGIPAGPWMLSRLDAPSGGGRTHFDLLRLVALLHDVAKPETKSIEPDGRMRFFGHAEKGAEIVAEMMRRLRFSSAEVSMAATMVRHHLRPGMLLDSGPPTSRAIYRYFRDTEPVGVDILVLSLADHRAARGALLDHVEYQKHLDLVACLAERRRTEEEAPPLVRLLSGDELMAELNLEPGPTVGRLLAVVAEAQALGGIDSREGALGVARDALETEGKG